MINIRLDAMRNRLSAACAAAGRDPATVKLLAVSKTFGSDAVLEAIAAGQSAFGENYIAEGVEKIQSLRTQQGLEWHCIGPVQSNKTRLVAEHFDWVQSVDRLKIAQRFQNAGAQGRIDHRHRFIGHQQARLQQQRAGHVDT